MFDHTDGRYPRWAQPRPRLRALEEHRLWLEADSLDAERELMEMGPGGDIDAGGRLTRTGRIYIPGLKRTVSCWLRLYERVQRGDLGGEQDGAQREGVAQATLESPG